jgi:hypothetical protein
MVGLFTEEVAEGVAESVGYYLDKFGLKRKGKKEYCYKKDFTKKAEAKGKKSMNGRKLCKVLQDR